MGQATMKKASLIKRITNKGYNLQVMAINCLKQFLKIERDLDKERQAEHERQQKEKERILRRIMDTNLRFAGMGFRQALQHTVTEREKEIALFKKQRGVMMRMLDSNTRLMGMGFNKLIEESKARKEFLRNKLKFVIKSITDKDSQFT